MQYGICGSGDKFWTQDRVVQLKDGLMRKLSARQIGLEIGASRNAVIGKVSRLGLAFANPEPSAIRAARARSAKNDGSVLASIKARQRQARGILGQISDNRIKAAVIARETGPGKLPKLEAVALTAGPIARDPVDLLDLRDDHCRWPIGDPGEEGFGFCGAPRRDNKVPYCTHHCRIAYRTPRTINEFERERRRRLGKHQVASGAWSCGFSSRGEVNGL